MNFYDLTFDYLNLRKDRWQPFCFLKGLQITANLLWWMSGIIIWNGYIHRTRSSTCLLRFGSLRRRPKDKLWMQVVYLEVNFWKHQWRGDTKKWGMLMLINITGMQVYHYPLGDYIDSWFRTVSFEGQSVRSILSFLKNALILGISSLSHVKYSVCILGSQRQATRKTFWC